MEMVINHGIRNEKQEKPPSCHEQRKSILPLLTKEENDIFRRAKNAKKPTKAKHASVAEYNIATGFEAILGYLYLIGQNERLNFLLNEGKINEG